MLGALLPACAAAQRPTTAPKFTWYQTESTLVLDVQCASPATLQQAEGSLFSLACTTAKDDSALLEFELREPIVQPSTCKPTGRKLHCILTKHHDHAYDRLSASVEALKGIAKVDYDHWQELERWEPSTTQYSVAHVKLLDSPAALEAARQQHEVVVLDVFYPWCTSCESKRAAFNFAAAAATLAAPTKAFFGAVDALEQRELRSQLNASCGWECTHLVMRRGEPPATVQARGDQEAEALLKELGAYMRPALPALETAEQLAVFRAANPVSVVGHLQAAETAEYAQLEAAARALRVRFSMGVLLGSPLGDEQLAAQGVHLLREAGDGGRARLPLAKMAGANLTQWISVHALDTLVDYSWERRDLVERLGLPCVSVFVDDEASGTDATPAPSYLADAARAVLSEVAAELRGRVVFLILKRSTSSYMMEDYGFGSTQPLPAVGISDSFDYDAPKFGYQGELLAAPLRAYVTDYLADRLKPTIKSAPPPDEDWQLGTPQTVVGSTLEAEVVASEMDVLLCLHAPYSFEKLNVTLHRLAMVVAPATMAKVATMDTMSNFFDPATFGGTVEKYHAEPVLMVWSGKGEERSMRKFKGKANLKTLLPFLKKHSTSLREHWPAVKRVLDADNAKLSAEKAAVAARVTQFKVTAEAATPTDVCCNGDGGVVKRIITEGRGEVPPKGSLIHAQCAATMPPPLSPQPATPLPRTSHKPPHARYTGRVFSTPGGEASRLLEGPIFDSSRDRDQPFEFTLGQGQVRQTPYTPQTPCTPRLAPPNGVSFTWCERSQVISGWDRGFASMRVGERALLTLSPEYAYGGGGSGKIPGSATLEFEVELLSFRTPGHEKSEL